MSACRYLEGENIAPRTAAEAKALIGKRVQYLRSVDIDRSGRGYYYPRTGRVTDAFGRNIDFNEEQNYHPFSRITEMILLPEQDS